MERDQMGLTLIPWQRGKPLTWDLAVVSGTSRLLCFRFWAFDWCSRRVLAAATKNDEYSNLTPSYLFQPIAIENLDTMNKSFNDFFRELDRRIVLGSDDFFESRCLFQRLSFFNSTIRLCLAAWVLFARGLCRLVVVPAVFRIGFCPFGSLLPRALG